MAFPFSNSLIPLKIKVTVCTMPPKALHDLFTITSLTSSPPLSLVHVAIFASLPLFRPISKPLHLLFPSSEILFPNIFVPNSPTSFRVCNWGNLKIQRPCKDGQTSTTSKTPKSTWWNEKKKALNRLNETSQLDTVTQFCSKD